MSATPPPIRDRRFYTPDHGHSSSLSSISSSDSDDAIPPPIRGGRGVLINLNGQDLYNSSPRRPNSSSTNASLTSTETATTTSIQGPYRSEFPSSLPDLDDRLSEDRQPTPVPLSSPVADFENALRFSFAEENLLPFMDSGMSDFDLESLTVKSLQNKLERPVQTRDYSHLSAVVIPLRTSSIRPAHSRAASPPVPERRDVLSIPTKDNRPMSQQSQWSISSNAKPKTAVPVHMVSLRPQAVSYDSAGREVIVDVQHITPPNIPEKSPRRFSTQNRKRYSIQNTLVPGYTSPPASPMREEPPEHLEPCRHHKHHRLPLQSPIVPQVRQEERVHDFDDPKTCQCVSQFLTVPKEPERPIPRLERPTTRQQRHTSLNFSRPQRGQNNMSLLEALDIEPEPEEDVQSVQNVPIPAGPSSPIRDNVPTPSARPPLPHSVSFTDSLHKVVSKPGSITSRTSSRWSVRPQSLWLSKFNFGSESSPNIIQRPDFARRISMRSKQLAPSQSRPPPAERTLSVDQMSIRSIQSLPQQDWRTSTAGLGSVTTKEQEYLKKKEMEALLWSQLEAEKLEDDDKKRDLIQELTDRVEALKAENAQLAVAKAESDAKAEKLVQAKRKTTNQWAQPNAIKTWWM